MLFKSNLRSKRLITIPALINKKLNLNGESLIRCKIKNSEFISHVYEQNQSFCFVIPDPIIKKLNLKLGAEIKLIVKLYLKKVKDRKELALLNFNLFYNKENIPEEEDFRFSKINKQLDKYDFNPNDILFKIEKLNGEKYKFVNLPEEIGEGNYILFRYNNTLFIRRIFQKRKLSVPTRFYFKDSKNYIEILKIIKKNNSFKKSRSPYVVYDKRKFIDIKYFLPRKLTVNGARVNLMVQEFPVNKLIISYDMEKSKGKVKKPLIIDRYIPLNIFVQFLGFYFGDGFKKNSLGIGGVNSEEKVVLWVDTFLKTYFNESIIYGIVHGNKKLNNHSEENIKKHWGNICGESITKIFYNKSNKNPKKYGSLRVYLSQIISRRIFNYFLDLFHKLIKKDSNLSKFYLRGIAMSDMGVCYKKGRLSCISIGHQKDNNNLRIHYKDILNSYGITKSLVYGPSYIGIYNLRNYITLVNDDIFKDHPIRRKKLIRGISNLNKGKIIKRLKLFKNPITAEGFRKSIEINDDPYGQLSYFRKNNLISEIPTYPKLYILNSCGKKLLGNINSS